MLRAYQDIDCATDLQSLAYTLLDTFRVADIEDKAMCCYSTSYRRRYGRENMPRSLTIACHLLMSPFSPYILLWLISSAAVLRASWLRDARSTVAPVAIVSVAMTVSAPIARCYHTKMCKFASDPKTDSSTTTSDQRHFAVKEADTKTTVDRHVLVKSVTRDSNQSRAVME
jgi:hypothetical protein